MSAVVLTAALGAGAALTGGSPAEADESPAKATTAHVMSKVGRFADVVTTDQGVSVAMWSASDNRTRLEWAVKRPGKPWSRPKVKGDWAVSPFRHGVPQLATSSGHRVTATWLDRRRRMVVENWSPTHGWSKPVHLSDRRHTAWDPQIVSNAASMVAISWSSQEAGFKNPSFASVAVRRGGLWDVQVLGPKKLGGTPGYAVQLGIAGDGAVTAAWENVQGSHPTFLARRLPSGTATWDPLDEFGTLDSEYFNSDPMRLAVQPDGSELVSRPAEDSQNHRVFTRVGGGDWIDQGVQPFGGFGGGSLSLPTGALVMWTDRGVFEDPDGIAGPAPLSGLGASPGGGPSTEVLATSDGTLVTVMRKVKRIVYYVHPAGGDWSPEQTVYRTARNIPTLWSAAMSADGRVTALFGTRPAGSSGHHPLRMEAIRFDATPAS